MTEHWKPLFAPSPEGYEELLDQLMPKVVYDLGANDGTWVQAYLNAGATEVHAFEPVPDMAVKLKARFRDNRKVVVNQFAVAESSRLIPGVRVCYAWALLQGARDDAVALDYRDQPAFDMQSTSLDEYVERNSLPDFVKVDVDGYEFNVLQGGRKLFINHRPPMIFEYSDLLRHLGQPVEQMCDLIYAFGYEAVSLDGQYRCPDAQTMVNLCPRGSSYDVLLLPKELSL